MNRRIVEEASHIFAMTRSHKMAIEQLFPFAAEKTFLGGSSLQAKAPIDESGSAAKLSATASWWF